MGKSNINIVESIMLRVLHQKQNVSCYQLVKDYGKKYAERSIYRHAKKPLHEVVPDRRKFNKGRPRKLNTREERQVIRALRSLRRERAGFTSKTIQERAGLGTYVSNRDIQRCLRRNGYTYRQSRKKGLLTPSDFGKRLQFARRHLRSTPPVFWTDDIGFYLDGVGFAYKRNPCGEARATSSMTWRKPKEGIKITTKGKKEGSGGKMANFFVGISHGHGIVLCHHHTWKITGDNVANFITDVFPGVFQSLNCPPGQRKFLQDGCPRQNSKVAEKAWTRIACEVVKIPARSPDLNPIENFFHLVRRKLADDADRQQIEVETYDQFVERIKKTMLEYDKDTINNMVASMPKRLEEVVKNKGGRTAY